MSNLTFCALLALAATPGERRIQPSGALASSSAEGHHALYAADDDGKTSWAEARKGNGEGEWLELFVPELDGVTNVRVELRNGCQESKGVFKQNARAKSLELSLLPSGTKATATLKDVEPFQRVNIPQPAGKLTGVRIEIGAALAGAKRDMACISDVQLFATSSAKDNAAFEKKLSERTAEWTAGRDLAERLFAREAKRLPFLASYALTVEAEEDAIDVSACNGEPRCAVEAVLSSAKKSKEEPHKAAIEIASLTLGADFRGWTPAELAAKDTRSFPMVEGLCVPVLVPELRRQGCAGALELPSFSWLALLRARELELKPAKEPVEIADVLSGKAKRCSAAGAPPYVWSLVERVENEEGSTQDTLRALLLVSCGPADTRDGDRPAAMLQLLVYDDAGRLEIVAMPAAVSSYDWSEGAVGHIVSGRRYAADGRSLALEPHDGTVAKEKREKSETTPAAAPPPAAASPPAVPSSRPSR